MEKKIVIHFDFHRKDVPSLSYVEILEEIKKETPIIYTTVLDFFSFSTLDKGYDVEVIKSNGEYIRLSELLKNDKSYSMREIRKAHHVHKMLLANSFHFKSKI